MMKLWALLPGIPTLFDGPLQNSVSVAEQRKDEAEKMPGLLSASRLACFKQYLDVAYVDTVVFFMDW